MEDFRQTWKLLSIYLKMEISDDAISDLAVTIDSNQDGSIDIDEFMEAFRLTDKKSRLERGRSMFMNTHTDLTKLDTDPHIWLSTGDRGGSSSSESGSDALAAKGRGEAASTSRFTNASLHVACSWGTLLRITGD